MSILNDMTKKDMRKCVRDRGFVADLHPTRRVVLRHRFFGIIFPEIECGTFPSESWVCWFLLLVARSRRADQRGCQVGLSPLAVARLPCSLDDEEAEAFSTPRTIMGVGFEWLFLAPLRFPLWYKLWGMGCQTPYPTISIFRESEQQRSFSPLIIKLALPHCL
jgi:hypothetical protein